MCPHGSEGKNRVVQISYQFITLKLKTSNASLSSPVKRCPLSWLPYSINSIQDGISPYSDVYSTSKSSFHGAIMSSMKLSLPLLKAVRLPQHSCF